MSGVGTIEATIDFVEGTRKKIKHGNEKKIVKKDCEEETNT